MTATVRAVRATKGLARFCGLGLNCPMKSTFSSTLSSATLAAFTAVLAGCGDDDAGGGATCVQVCAKVEAANCENDSDCMSTCNDVKDSTPMGCTGSYSALTNCYAGATFTCDADEESVAEGCGQQEIAYAECVQSGGEDDGNTDAGGGNEDDVNAGSGGDAMGNAGAGATDSCSGLTVGGECGECLEGSCCDDLLACQDDSDCPTLTECVGNCSDSSCQQTCADASSSSAVDLYNAFIDCATRSCEAECSDGSTSGSEDVGAPNDGNGGHTPTMTPPDCLELPADTTGYCEEVTYKVIYDCPNGPPFDDCELNAIDASGIYCCGH